MKRKKFLFLGVMIFALTYLASTRQVIQKRTINLKEANSQGSKNLQPSPLESKVALSEKVKDENMLMNDSGSLDESIKLPDVLARKVLLTEIERKQIQAHYANPKKILKAITTIQNISAKPVGKVGIARIDSIDFIEKALSYRNNQSRSQIIRFIENFTLNCFASVPNIESRKFFVGDQLELLEILAFNLPKEFLYLKERTSDEKVLNMMKLVEHHANRNL